MGHEGKLSPVEESLHAQSSADHVDRDDGVCARLAERGRQPGGHEELGAKRIDKSANAIHVVSNGDLDVYSCPLSAETDYIPDLSAFS
jgi:hypothetical protein